MFSVIFFAVLAAGCFIYWCVMVSYAGLGTAFAPVWFAAFIFFALTAVAVFLNYRKIWNFPVTIKRIFVIFICICFIFFLTVEGFIVSGMISAPKSGLDYVIVLGAQVRGTRITKSLKKRLETARDYLEDNPDTVAVVSGGQGEGEDLSEARCMYDWLVENGISSDRIILEDQPTNTDENIDFSMKLIKEATAGDTEPSVGVITNNFHVFRTVKVCEKKGCEVSGIPAPSDRILFINYMVREFFAVVKYKLSGSI